MKQQLEKLFIKFGESGSPTFVALSIATAKGIFRPIFTMADKQQDYETKRYTALREGLTELIAILIYYLSGVASKAISKKLCVPKNFMSKDMYEKHLAGDSSAEVLNAVAKAKDLAKDNLSKIKTTTSFIGVCLSALIFIPLICSIAIKPIMKMIQNKDGKAKRDIAVNPVTYEKVPNNKPNVQTFKSLYPQNMYGMKVGGL